MDCYESLLKVLQNEARFQSGEANVFFIGPTKVGKSTLAWTLCFETPDVYLVPVQASKWIKEQYSAASFASYPEYVAFLTQKSRELLAKDPDCAVKRIKQSFNCCGGGCLIEGVRNPRDFMQLFDYRKDLVVFLSRNGMEVVNEFEEGIEVIKQYVKWLEKNFEGKFSMEVEL